MLEENGGQDRRDLDDVDEYGPDEDFGQSLRKLSRSPSEMTLGAVDHVDSMLADSEDEAMFSVEASSGDVSVAGSLVVVKT